LPKIHQHIPLQDSALLSKEEFGLDLYKAIETIGGILGLETQRTAAIHAGHGYKVQNLLQRRLQLIQEWEHHRAVLPYSEIQQIIAHYPWVRDL